jgi:hypothetical protein
MCRTTAVARPGFLRRAAASSSAYFALNARGEAVRPCQASVQTLPRFQQEAERRRPAGNGVRGVARAAGAARG